VNIVVRLYASLRKYYPGLAPGEPLCLQLPDGTSINSLLDRLGVPCEETKQAFVNGRVQALDYMLKDGDECGIFPPIAGGTLVG
jgi:molybdopterin converting factor small subunit